MISIAERVPTIAPHEGVTFIDLDVSSDESVTAGIQQVIERFDESTS